MNHILGFALLLALVSSTEWSSHGFNDKDGLFDWGATFAACPVWRTELSQLCPNGPHSCAAGIDALLGGADEFDIMDNHVVCNEFLSVRDCYNRPEAQQFLNQCNNYLPEVCGCARPHRRYGLGGYGFPCGAWDSTDLSPFWAWPENRNDDSTACDVSGGADYCGRESWCRQEWCYIGYVGDDGMGDSDEAIAIRDAHRISIQERCPGAYESSLVDGLYYSYQSCGMFADCYNNPESAGCPYDPNGRCVPNDYDNGQRGQACATYMTVDVNIFDADDCAYAANARDECGQYFQVSTTAGCQCSVLGQDCRQSTADDTSLYTFLNVEECDETDCSNHGSGNGFRPACQCTCDIGWTGTTCEVAGGRCHDMWDCGNRGTARHPDQTRPIITEEDFCECFCDPGFEGKSCQISRQSGAPSPPERFEDLERLNEAACFRHGVPTGFGHDFTCECDLCYSPADNCETYSQDLCNEDCVLEPNPPGRNTPEFYQLMNQCQTCGQVMWTQNILQPANGGECNPKSWICEPGHGRCLDPDADLGCGPGNPGPSGCDNQCGSTLEDLGCGCGEPGPSGCDNQCGSTLEDLGCGCGSTLEDLGCGCGSTLEDNGFGCGACVDTLLDIVGSSYTCDGQRDSNQVDCSASQPIYNFNEPFRFSFSFISDIENQYGHILGFRNMWDADSPMIAFGYRYVAWRNIGATATLTARNNAGLFVMHSSYGQGNLAIASIANPVGTEINVEFTWDGTLASATINGQMFSTPSSSGFGTYSRAQLCFGIGGGATAFVGTINNLEISPLNGRSEEESWMSEFAASANGLILTRALAIVGLAYSAHFLWSSYRSQKQFRKIPDEQEV